MATSGTEMNHLPKTHGGNGNYGHIQAIIKGSALNDHVTTEPKVKMATRTMTK